MPEATAEANHPNSANANHSSVSLTKNASRPALVRKVSKSSKEALNQAVGGSKSNLNQSLGPEDGFNGSIQEFGEQQLYENTYKMKPDIK